MHAEANGRLSAPVAGDVSICWHCTGIGIYVQTLFGLTSEKPTDEEMAVLMSDPELRSALAAATTAVALSETPEQAFPNLN